MTFTAAERAGAPIIELMIRAATILRTIGVVDEVVDRTVDRLESDFLRHTHGEAKSGCI